MAINKDNNIYGIEYYHIYSGTYTYRHAGRTAADIQAEHGSAQIGPFDVDGNLVNLSDSPYSRTSNPNDFFQTHPCTGASSSRAADLELENIELKKQIVALQNLVTRIKDIASRG